MENWSALIYLLGAGQGFVLGVALIMQYKKPNKSNVFLGLIILVVSLELLNVWGMQINYHASPNVFPYWNFISYLILPPTLWLFVQTNTNPGFRFKKRWAFLFLSANMSV